MTAAGTAPSSAAVLHVGQAKVGRDLVSYQFIYNTRAEPTLATTARLRPKLPVNFVQRDVIAEANSKLATFRTCILVGPTGMGKSVGATSIFLDSASTNSLWLEAPTLEPSQDFGSADLIVLDDLSISHPILTNHWLRTLSSHLVVTTTRPDTAVRVLSDRGQANTREPIIEVGGFTESESTQFLDQVLGDLLSVDEKRAIATKLRGSPIGLQALPDLLFGQRDANSWIGRILQFFGWKIAKPLSRVNAFLPDTRKLDVEGVASNIMKQWIEQFRSPHAEQILRILCRTSMLGMNSETLAFVANMNTNEVNARLTSAVDKGFIRKAVNYRFPDLELLVPHDVLRGYFLALPTDDRDRTANVRYIEYLKSKPAVDPASQVDAIMAGIQNAFDLSSEGDRFEDNFNRFASMLQKVLVDENLPSAQLERIAGLLAQKLCAETLDSCSMIISLAHSVGFLPASGLLAEIIWAGSGCKDSWARGASIRAAVHHWIAIDRREVGLAHVQQWLDHYISCPDRPHYDPFGREDEDDITVDLDIAAAIGGLCALGHQEAALERLETAWTIRQREHSWCTIAHHTLLIGLADSGRKDLLSRSLEKFWADIPDEPHKRYVQAYLESKGIVFAAPSCLEIEQSPYAATVARAAHSETFRKFILTRQPRAQACI